MRIQHAWWTLCAVLTLTLPAGTLCAADPVQDIQTAVTGTNGSDTINNTTARTADATIDTDSDVNVLTDATGIDALAGNDHVENLSPVTARGDSRIDLSMKFSGVKAESRGTGIDGASGKDTITNASSLTTTSFASCIIWDFMMFAVDVGMTGWPTESIALSTGIDGGAGLDSVTNTGGMYVEAEAQSTAIEGTVNIASEPVDIFSMADARTTATSTATGINGGSFASAGAQTENLTNNGVMTVHSHSTASAFKLVFELLGAARIDGSTTAESSTTGIAGGAQHNVITNGGSMFVTAESEASSFAFQLKMKGLMLKALLNLFGLDVGKTDTSATASATGIDGESGNDTITNSPNAGIIDAYAKATADSKEITVAISPPTGGGEESAAAAAVAPAAAVSAPVYATADAGAQGQDGDYADADTVSTATATGIAGGAGQDTIDNSATLTARTESYASSLGVNVDVSLSKESYLPIPGAAVADTKVFADAVSTGIDGGSGNDTITNSAPLSATSYAEGDATTIGATVKGSLEGLSMGVTVVDSSSTAHAVSKGIAGGSGGDTITNSGSITSLATAKDDSDSIAVAAAGGKTGMAFGVALADASSNALAYGYGIDAGGEEAGAGPVPGDTVKNYGTIDVDAISNTSTLSVGVAFSAELEGVVGGVSAAKGDSTAEAIAAGVRTGGGADTVLSEGAGFLSAVARATSASDVVAVTVSAAWKGVALGASLADANTTATAAAAGIEAGAGDDSITNGKALTSTAIADATSDVIAITVAVAPKGFSAGVAISNTETNATASAAGISGGEGRDGVTNQSTVDVDATASTEINSITINFAEAGAAIADSTSQAKAVATGLDGGAGVDSLTNKGTIDVSATSATDDTGATANFAGYAKGDITTTSIANATGIQGGPGSADERAGDVITNDGAGVITVFSRAQIDAENYVVQGGGAAIAKTGGTGSAYAAGIVGGLWGDFILNDGGVGVTAQTDLKAIGFNFQLLGVQIGSAGLNTTGTAVGIDAGGGRNTVTNSGTGTINVYADVNTFAGSVVAGFSAGVVSAGVTADVTSRGIGTGDDRDTIENYGGITVSQAALGEAGAGSIGLLALSMANSVASGTIEGINAGGGDDLIVNGLSGQLTVGTVDAGHDALVKADTEAIAFDFFSLVFSTLGAKARVTGIEGGGGNDTIANSGIIQTGDSDSWMVFGESYGFGGQILGAESAYAGTTVTGNAAGIGGGGDDDTITNTGTGIITVDARGLADVATETYVLFGTFLPLTSKSTANGTTSAAGIDAGAGSDLVENYGTVTSTSFMRADSRSSADLPSGIEASPFAESTGKAEAYSTAVNLGAGSNTAWNSGTLTAQATALTRSYAYSTSDFLRTYGESYARSIADAAGVAGGNDGNTVLNAATGAITATATAKTDDGQGNVTRVDADEEATAVGGEWSAQAQKWLPVAASAAGVSLGSGDDTVVNDGGIVVSSISDTLTAAYTSAWTRNTQSEARAVGAATAKGISAGAGHNAVTNNGQVTVSALGNAFPNTDAWSRDYSAATDSIAEASAAATGIEGDGDLSNSSGGVVTVTARATTYAYSNTEAENADATADASAAATGMEALPAAPALQQAEPVQDVILNAGSIVVSALAGESANGNVQEMAYVDTDTWVRSCRAEARGTATAGAFGIRVYDEGKQIVNTGTIQVLGRSRAYLRAFADSRDYWPVANAWSTGVATAAGISASGGDNRIYNYGTLGVTASVLDTYSQGDTWASWHTCRSSAETTATATAAGISAGDGNDTIDNNGGIAVAATANAESFAWADTRDNNLADEYETTTSAAHATAVGIDAAAGVNVIRNTGTLSVSAAATAWAHAGGGHASVTASEHGSAAATGIAVADGGSTIYNSGTIDVSASVAAYSIDRLSAVGILGGAGADTIINEGTITTGIQNNHVPPGAWLPGIAIDSAAGDDAVALLDGSVVAGDIKLGLGDDLLQFYGNALLTGDVDAGLGDDTVIFDGPGQAQGGMTGFELGVKQGAGTFTVDLLPELNSLETNEGVLEVMHDCQMPSNGVFSAQVFGGGTCGALAVHGQAALDGGLVVKRGPGMYVDGASYDILTADSLTGGFDETVLPEPTVLLSFDAAQLADRVRVVAEVKDCAAGAAGPSQAQIAQCLDRIMPNAPEGVAGLIGQLQTLGERDLSRAFDTLSPDSHGAATSAALAAALQTTRAYQRRMGNVRAGMAAAGYDEIDKDGRVMLAYSGSEAGVVQLLKSREEESGRRPYGVWFDGFGQYGTQDGDADFTGFNYATHGTALGIDQAFTDSFLAGASANWAYTGTDMDRGKGTIDLQGVGGSLYGSYFADRSYVEGVLSYAHQRYNSCRNVVVGPLEQTARGTHDGDAFSSSLGGGYMFRAGEWDFGPFGSAHYTQLNEEGFWEHGADGANLKVADRSTDSLVSQLGFRAQRTIEKRDGLLVPELSVAWNHDWGIDDGVVRAAFAGAPDSSFSIKDNDPDKNGATVGVGMTWVTEGGASVQLKYSAELRDDYRAHSFTAGFRYDF